MFTLTLTFRTGKPKIFTVKKFKTRVTKLGFRTPSGLIAEYPWTKLACVEVRPLAAVVVNPLKEAARQAQTDLKVLASAVQ